MHDEDGPSVREAREEKRLEDRSIWIMLLCGFPLIYFAVAYPSLTTLIIFQAYILTFTVAGMLGIKKRALLKQKWFLNAMAYSLPIHLVAIAGIFFGIRRISKLHSKGSTQLALFGQPA